MKYKNRIKNLQARVEFWEKHKNSAQGSPMTKKGFLFTKPGSLKK